MIIKQISIFVENRPGRLAEITDILAKNNINLRAMSIADTTNFGILRIIADDPDRVEHVLKEHSLTASITSVLSVSISDSPGGLSHVLKILADNDIPVEYMYAFLSQKDPSSAYVVMRLEDEVKAVRLLTEAGYKGSSEIK